jgi:negative regulator of flagellin synthesis FlgM
MPDPIQGVSTGNPVGVASTGQTGAAHGNARPADTPAAPAADTVDVGNTAGLLTTIADAASQVPGIDQAKVDALQQAIAGGTYQVDAQAIAEKMLNIESSLSGGGSGP